LSINSFVATAKVVESQTGGSLVAKADNFAYIHDVQNASNIADAYMEAHPLWEYPCKPLSPVFDVLHINMTKSVHGIKTVEREGTVELCR
jgi:hypothetical protein